MATVYNESEYHVTDLGDTKIILTIQDQFNLNDLLSNSGDLSGINLVVYARNIVVTNKIRVKSIRIYANTITTSQKMNNFDTLNSNHVVFFSPQAAISPSDMLLEFFDYQNKKYLSLSTSLSQGGVVLNEKTITGEKNIDLNTFMFAHPAWCSMMLQKASLLYRMGNPVLNKQSLNDAITIFSYLRDSLEIFNNPDVYNNKNSQLAQLYEKHEASVGGFDSITTFRNCYNSANGFLGQIKNGSDFYGNSYNYVPLGSKEFYQNILQVQIDNFAYIEKNFFSFIDANRSEEEKRQDLKTAVTSLSQISDNANSDISSLKSRATETATQIATLESQFEEKRNSVESRLDQFKKDISDSFNFDIQSLISSLTTAAFLKESPASALILSGASIGYDIYEAAETVKNDEGVTVQKDYLVNKIAGFAGEITSDTLSEQSKALNNGSIKLDDPGANKLLAEESKLSSFLSDFYTKFPDSTKALEQAFQDYVNLVLERNNKVIYYNSLITLIIKNHNIIKNSNQQRSLLNTLNLEQYSPGLAAFSVIMAGLYTSAQAQVMETLYLTERAFNFWSLSDEKPVTQLFSDNKLTSINTSVLKEAQSTILNFYEQIIENRKKTPPQIFSTGNNGRGSIVISLSDDQVTTLKQCMDTQYTVLFQIPYDTKQTSKEENPFAGYADIRLTSVYVWVDGVKTADNELTLTITHTGNETIVNPQNIEFNFTHNSKNVAFKYDINSGQILEGGNIGNTSLDNTYALVGPFAWWNLTIDANYNKHLDLSEITNVKVEFQGNNYPFN